MGNSNPNLHKQGTVKSEPKRGTWLPTARKTHAASEGASEADPHRDRRSKVMKDNMSYNLINMNTIGEPMEDFFEKYELTSEVLGKGSYAEVRLAKSIATQESFAVKIMIKSEMDQGDIDDMRREVEILKNLNHENIVKVYDYYEDAQLVYIVMEYLSGGELYKNIEDLEDYTEKDTRDIIITLIHALKYCKDRGIAHRDIKPENILLRRKLKKKKKKKQADETPGPAEGKIVKTSTEGKLKKLASLKDPEKEIRERDEIGFMVTRQTLVSSVKVAKRKYEIVLADFGFAIQVSRAQMKGKAGALQTQCGTPLFLAPEIVQEKNYNYKCDIWSLGVVCFMLLSGGSLPFPATSANELYAKVLKCKWDFEPKEAWTNVSDNAKDFLKKVILLKPSKRLNYDQLLKHPWFADSKINTFNPDMSVNFDAMKQFNARRKVLKAIRARQAAMRFRKLMSSLERKSKNITSLSLDKYIQAVKLTDFYNNPSVTTDAEKDFTLNKTRKVSYVKTERQKVDKKQISHKPEESVEESDEEDDGPVARPLGNLRQANPEAFNTAYISKFV